MLHLKREEGQGLVEYALILLLVAIVVIIPFLLIGSSLTGCSQSAQSIETQQRQSDLKNIIQNQPVPNLNGYSLERDIVIQIVNARNSRLPTHTYYYNDFTGKVIKVCDSIGLPIPYSTQLTAPEAEVLSGGHYTNLPQPEPNSLYSPDSAEATIVACVGADGTIIPTYWEPRVFALPYEINSDLELFKPITESSLQIKLSK